jgi:hypothetical protein
MAGGLALELVRGGSGVALAQAAAEVALELNGALGHAQTGEEVKRLTGVEQGITLIPGIQPGMRGAGVQIGGRSRSASQIGLLGHAGKLGCGFSGFPGSQQFFGLG